MYEDHIRSPYEPELATCGFFLVPRPGGFVLHMSASAEHISEMRSHVFKTVCTAGAAEPIADAARLVASELVGNVVRLCGPWAPVVVRVTSTDEQILVEVHDPVQSVIPDRQAEPPDSAYAETGRGLRILDVLAPGWTVQRTPVGKRITCTLPREETAAA
ncbi:anti-sigma regulatory factor (Ser/Thr protein kinase) [Kitasatospora sp. MAA4]|uniref:ATP-binding protein n=1 Tax=Kitasatospora sp. MAA4 TaxID=3035093 RepID=UPI002473C8FD|nr:ATP-binding protein [Kitasatospora sp. MAA4]MDH6136450.1 anti-sigma regulatory factor (Ser/Thr protein kinase) [Kitasatospora sp. MAA4]